MTEAAAIPEALVWWGREDMGLNVWEAALERTRHAFQLFDHLFVSFSGGKDSTCVLNVALTVARELGRLPLRVVFFDEECISHLTEEYVRRVAALDDIALEWYCLPVEHRNACSVEEPHWWPWAPEARDLWVRDLPTEALTQLDGFQVEPREARLSIPLTCERLIAPALRYGNAGALMGIRANESMTRRRAVSNKRRENWIIPSSTIAGYSKVYPVYDWTAQDVWTAPATMGWDYNRTYDVLSMHGFTPSQQRCAPPFGEEPMGDLHQWAACFPELWDRMVARVPGAACGARYARTELYAYGETPTKPDGMTWQAFIRQLVEAQDDPALRRFIAHKIRTMVKRHYGKTSDLIAGQARHPVTGMSWQYLSVIAARGDTKDRKMIMEVQGGKLMNDEGWAAYRNDVAACKARGEL